MILKGMMRGLEWVNPVWTDFSGREKQVVIYLKELKISLTKQKLSLPQDRIFFVESPVNVFLF